ncbi:MAG: ATP-binding protein, partial [Desulfurococcaceae archaeon]
QQATAVALILNELIQNAIEHGFKEQEVGHIHVQVRDSAGQVTLIVTNDGLPLPPDFDASKSNTLGLKIIDNLTRGTLRGKFTMVSENGQTVATLCFPRAGS